MASKRGCDLDRVHGRSAPQRQCALEQEQTGSWGTAPGLVPAVLRRPCPARRQSARAGNPGARTHCVHLSHRWYHATRCWIAPWLKAWTCWVGHPYRSGALIELVPAYLHFLARLGLIHPGEMDEALTNLRSLGVQMSQILDRWGADIHMVHAVEAAWSDAQLDAWRHDPALDCAAHSRRSAYRPRRQQPGRKPSCSGSPISSSRKAWLCHRDPRQPDPARPASDHTGRG